MLLVLPILVRGLFYKKKIFKLPNSTEPEILTHLSLKFHLLMLNLQGNVLCTGSTQVT